MSGKKPNFVCNKLIWVTPLRTGLVTSAHIRLKYIQASLISCDGDVGVSPCDRLYEE